MTDVPVGPDTRLREGIAAARAGDRGRARACLLAVVESDERNVQAWYWLSRIVESAEDRQVCLENVLALDPGHRAVQAELAALRHERAVQAPPQYATRAAAQKSALGSAAPGRVSAPAPAQVRPAAPVVPSTPEEILISDAATDPLPCPYCGTIVPPLDRACSACGRSLWARERKTQGHSIYSLCLMLFWLALANYAWFGLCIAYLGATLASTVAGSPRASAVLHMLGSFFGTPAAAGQDLPLLPVLAACGVAFVLSLTIAAGLYARSRFFYWLTVGLAILASLPILYQAATADNLPLLRLAIGLVLFLVTMSLIFMAHDEYAWRERRLAAVVDPDVISDSALFARGRRCAEQGMWARAAVHWARAVALNPSHPDHRLALATAYLNLNRPDRAAEHLHAIQDLDPANPDALALLRQLPPARG